MVNFVGAGCGAADLITLRGARLLNRADVVMLRDLQQRGNDAR